ncbi:hypothetical protein V1477_001487 [Vespula maculifrons]|uniref:Maturase K n=1 Tax=Vespula maculifrons TaxID=7453 RepID=A0ABD2CYR3_VESMC
MCFTSDVECLTIKLRVIDILVSSLEVITIQITVDSAPSQHFMAIELLSPPFCLLYLWKSLQFEQKTSENEEIVPFGLLMRLFSTYLHIQKLLTCTRSEIIERMTFTGKILPEIVRSEDRANFRGMAQWKGLLDSKPINQYHILYDRKSGNILGPEEEIPYIIMLESVARYFFLKHRPFLYLSRGTMSNTVFVS